VKEKGDWCMCSTRYIVVVVVVVAVMAAVVVVVVVVGYRFNEWNKT